jgi:hypothetical protein
MVGVCLQIRRARVKVQVQCLTTNIDWRQKQRSVLLRSGHDSARLVGSGGAGSGIGSVSFSTLALLLLVDETLGRDELCSRLQVVLPEHLPHSSHSIRARGVGLVQLPRDLE